MSEDSLTKETTLATANGNQLTIALETTQQKLPEPTKVSTSLGDIFYRSLLSAFASAVLTQVVLLLPLPAVTSERVLSVAVGCSVFCVGLHWSLSKQLQPSVAFPASAVVAGVVLGL